MLDALLQQTTIPLLERVTDFGQRRHQVLAGNIANIDTPGYKTRDLPMQDFEKALQLAVQTRRDNLQSPGSWQQMTAAATLSPESLEQSQRSLLAGYLPASGPGRPGQPVTKIEDHFPATLHQASNLFPRNITFPDGGNRSIEKESMEMNKNTSMQSFAIEVMMSQIRMLETVISERVT